MVSSIARKYEEYKKYGNILVDYDEILIFYPDYYKTKIELENMKFLEQEAADQYFEKNYKKSKLYKKLVELAMSEDEIYDYMKHNKDLKYSSVKALFEVLVNSTINLCKLIDYIGHYPTTWPVPKEEEKDTQMEELLEKYDIMVRYHLNDELDKMQITSNDIVRIVDKLQENLDKIDSIKRKTTTNNWLLKRNLSDEKRIEFGEKLISEIEKFPLSNYQEKGKSKRKEGKKYLRLQHGKNII